MYGYRKKEYECRKKRYEGRITCHAPKLYMFCLHVCCSHLAVSRFRLHITFPASVGKSVLGCDRPRRRDPRPFVSSRRVDLESSNCTMRIHQQLGRMQWSVLPLVKPFHIVHNLRSIIFEIVTSGQFIPHSDPVSV
jgi:hypothetical protein